MDRGDVLQVVAAAIEDGGMILLTQRMPGKDYAYQWESPGGKVRPGETHRRALRREVREELGVGCKVLDKTPLFVARFNKSKLITVTCDVSIYRVSITYPEKPKMLAAVGMGWFTHDEMRKLNLAPANRMLVRAMRNQMSLRHAVFGE